MSSRVDRMKTIETAEKYIRLGKLKEAVAEYEKLVEGDSPDIGTVNIIGDLYIRLGQPQRAVKAFQKVAEEYEKRGLYSQSLGILKKITKLSPENPEFAIKQADLYSLQGFASDARNEYLKIADRFLGENKVMDALLLLEKAAKLDKDDLDSRNRLASLYKQQGYIDQAIDQLNEIAVFRMAKGQNEEAGQALAEARSLKDFHLQTLLNLVELAKRQNDRKKAIGLVEESVGLQPANPQLIGLLGNLHFEDGDFQKAEEIFAKLVSDYPMNVNARIKLGRLSILKEMLDQAFELFEPLVNSLLKKQKEEKAIGLLGLILGGQKTHLPSLDKLAGIYRTSKDIKKLEIVDRVILEELRREGLKDKTLAVISEILRLRPDDEALLDERRRLRKELGLPEEDSQPIPGLISENDQRLIDETLAQSDLYVQQGLVRNAKRILDNLNLKFPDEPQVAKKLAQLEKAKVQMDEDEIRRRIEKTSAMESMLKEKPEQKKDERRKEVRVPFPKETLDEEKLSTADIFAETDIIPFVRLDAGEMSYYDLREQIDDELRMIGAVHLQQAKGATLQYEQELTNIVSDFHKGLKEKLQVEDFEIHYQLGIAFLEQGLLNEAIEELTQASKDKARALECYSILSRCYRNKKKLSEAEKWLKKALLLAKQGSDQYFALRFDLAGLLEETRDVDQALFLYKEVKNWNPDFRNVADKIDALAKAAEQPA